MFPAVSGIVSDAEIGQISADFERGRFEIGSSDLIERSLPVSTDLDPVRQLPIEFGAKSKRNFLQCPKSQR